jgi:16S rRNA (guanine966-N2)-methyltransferase
LRITSGNLKGRKILLAEDSLARPTADKVRQAIFNIMGNFVEDVVVWDLFSGSGILGFEALSRGAKSVLFIDEDKESEIIIRKHAQEFGCDPQCKVLKARLPKGLNLCASLPAPDLVFLDPPYRTSLGLETLKALASLGERKPTWVVFEHEPQLEIEPIEGFELDDQRKYGDVALSFFYAGD